MRVLPFIVLLAALILPTVAFAEIQTFTATHTYILGDHDSKDDARQRCLLETKRKILEQAGVYIESVSEMENFDLTKDKITSFAAAVLRVKDTKENFRFQQGHTMLTCTITAQVDLAEVRKQAEQRQQGGQSSGRTSTSQPTDSPSAEMQSLHTRAAQGNAMAQFELGNRYDLGDGIRQDYMKARQWYEQAAVQENASAQYRLGLLYANGEGGLQDYGMARQWYEKAAAQGHANAQNNLGLLYENGAGGPRDYAMARQWYEQAADQGNATAQNNLGYFYVNGKGVPMDEKRGI